MKFAERPKNEIDRLNDLREYKIMDTPPELEFDDLVQLAAKIAKVPMSLITLLDENRQWFKSSVGVGFKETPRELSFCSHTILGNSLLLVMDTEQDERFSDNPFVTNAPGIRFYAGVPLMSYRGNPIGTLCVLDVMPGDLDEDQRFALNVLSRQVIKQLEIKRTNEHLEQITRTQSLLMTMILRDIKSPLAATGTFLNLLQENNASRSDIFKYARKAARQFNANLALLDTVVEWGRIYSSRSVSSSSMFNTDTFTAGLISDMQKISYSGEYSLINNAPDVQLEVGYLKELYYILNSAMLWLFNCADTGEIVIEEFSQVAQSVVIRIRMTSKSFSETVVRTINKLNTDSLWHNNPDLALDGLSIRLAKDIAIARNGSLVASYDKWAGIEINIYAEII